MTPENLLALVSGQSIALAEPVGGRVPQWTLVEAGFGMGALESPYSLAFCYRYARDASVYRRLYAKLLTESIRLAEFEHWKTRLNGKRYLEGLVEIVMAEEWMSDLNRQRLLIQMECNWPTGVYHRQIARKHRAIAMILDRWCAAAHEHIARRIRNDQEVELDEVG